MCPYKDLFEIVDLLAKIAIPIVIFFATKRVARAQYFNTAQTGWNEFNKLALGSKENQDVILKYMHPPSFVDGNPELARKAYLGFVYLNAANSYFVGVKNGLIDADHSDAQFSDLLGPFLLDDDFYGMSQGRGYHPQFREACRRARSTEAKKPRGVRPE